jgi:hypothetical protein
MSDENNFSGQVTTIWRIACCLADMSSCAPRRDPAPRALVDVSDRRQFRLGQGRQRRGAVERRLSHQYGLQARRVAASIPIQTILRSGWTWTIFYPLEICRLIDDHFLMVAKGAMATSFLFGSTDGSAFCLSQSSYGSRVMIASVSG